MSLKSLTTVPVRRRDVSPTRNVPRRFEERIRNVSSVRHARPRQRLREPRDGVVVPHERRCEFCFKFRDEQERQEHGGDFLHELVGEAKKATRA